MITIPRRRKIVLFIGLSLTGQAISVEQVNIRIDELESASGRINAISANLDLKSDNKIAVDVGSRFVALLPPYDWLQAFTLSCVDLVVNRLHTICNNGEITLNSKRFKQVNIPFQFQQVTSGHSGQLDLTEIPFSRNDSYLKLNWRKQLLDLNTEIKSLPLNPLADVFSRFGVTVSGGLVSLTGDSAFALNNHSSSNIQFSGDLISLQTVDATKAVEKLNLKSILQARTARTRTEGKFELQIRNGEIYLEPVYLPLKDASISVSSDFILDTQSKLIQLTDFALYFFPTMSFFGSLTTQLTKPFPPERGTIKIQVYNLENLFNYLIAPYIGTSGLRPVLSSTRGLILSELDFVEKQLTHVKLSTADVSATYAFNNQDISVNNARISLNWKPDHCTEKSFVYWKKAVFRGLPLPETVLRFTACGQQINFERNVTLPLLDGEMQFDHLDLKRLDNGAIDFSFATEIHNISLAALSESFDLPPLAGHLSASIPSVRLETGGLRMDSSIRINVFGGKIEIQHLQIDGMLGSYPILTADIHFENLDLGKLSKRFSFGNIEGKLNGTISGLRIENRKVVAFDAQFSTPENRLLPWTISQKAVENIASLGGSSPGDLLSRGVLKLFESFFYKRLGFSCKLRNNVCELQGIAQAKNNGFYLIKGMLAPQINVIGYNYRVNWSELAARLKRISSQSSPVVE